MIDATAHWRWLTFKFKLIAVACLQVQVNYAVVSPPQVTVVNSDDADHDDDSDDHREWPSQIMMMMQ